ncbi:MAG: citrate synthase [Acidobacteria bacterium]|nr:MAG: citrate synthase [Acidobacteriota bacterium]REK11320.1 MAG: citrate synthase [Acidobacteriota bacterium]
MSLNDNPSSPSQPPTERATAKTVPLRPSASGLDDVVAADTALSAVDGEAGELLIAGYPVDEIAPSASFEQTVHLLLHGRPPEAAEEAERVRARLADLRELPDWSLEVLAAAPRDTPSVELVAALIATLERDAEPERLVCQLTTIVAAAARHRAGDSPLQPRVDLGHSANFLYMLSGSEPTAARVRALDTYWNTVVDHGLNASTFTVRIVASTGSDRVAALLAGLGALQGPLHGGAPGGVLDLLDELDGERDLHAALRAKLDRGERLMGFGHRIYRTRDPRADVLRGATERLRRLEGSDGDLFDFAGRVEQAALELLRERWPQRVLDTNVEFYTALLLRGLGLEANLFTAMFAAGRCAGWMAHFAEQQEVGRLVRPQSRFCGERRHWCSTEPTPVVH